MLADLLAEMERQGGHWDGTGPEPVVDLELFFDGNGDPGSIGCNLIRHPGIPAFFEVLRIVRERPEVHTVDVGIAEILPPGEWPFSDHVYVVTTASSAEVMHWVSALEPNDAGTNWWCGEPPLRHIEIPPGFGLVTLCWD